MQMSPEQRKAMMIERYKNMGCNDVQADTLMSIMNSLRPKMMGLRDLGEEERAAKMKELNDERNAKIEKAFPAELAKKLIEELSKQRMGGGGGGRPGGGGGRPGGEGRERKEN